MHLYGVKLLESHLIGGLTVNDQSDNSFKFI